MDPTDEPRRTSPLTVLSGFIQLGMAFVVSQATFPGATGPDSDDIPGFLVFLVVVLVVRGLRDTIGWWMRTYRLQPTQLVLDEGVLARRRKVVPYVRLQQVDIVQGPIARAFNLAELRFSTAGDGQSSTVVLRFIDHAHADQLRTWFLARRSALTGASAGGSGAHRAGDHQSIPDADAIHEPICSLTNGRVVLATLTSGSVLLMGSISLLAAGLLLLGSINPAVDDLLPQGLVFFIAFFGGVATVTSAVGGVIGTWNWTLTASGDDLHARFGLLTVRQVMLPRRRIQSITVSDNPLRRAFGLAQVVLASAAGGAEASSQLTIPLVSRAEVGPLLERAMANEQWRPPPLVPRTAPARRRAVLRRSVAALLPALLVSWVVAVPLDASPTVALALGILAVAAALILGVAWGRVAHTRAGWAATPTVVSVAAGVLTHEQVVLPVARVQSALCTSSPFQRLAGLVTLQIDVAGARSLASLYDMDADLARQQRLDLPRRASQAPSLAALPARPQTPEAGPVPQESSAGPVPQESSAGGQEGSS